MIRTDGRPTIAWAPKVISNRDPGDEQPEENEPSCEELWAKIERGIEQLHEDLQAALADWPPAEPVYGGF